MAVVIFFCCQVYINCKQGVTAMPFLHYGMYAGKFPVAGTIEPWELEVNGRPVDLGSFHGKTVDYIIEPLKIYLDLGTTGKAMFHSHIDRFLKPLHLPHSIEQFDPAISHAAFSRWYTQRLSSLLDVQVREVSVYKNTYSVDGARFARIKQILFFHATN